MRLTEYVIDRCKILENKFCTRSIDLWMSYVEDYDPSRWAMMQIQITTVSTRYSLTVNLIKIMRFLNVDWFQHIEAITVYLFSPHWKWPQESPKHVSGNYLIKWHSYSKVGFFKNIMYLINTRNVEHIKQSDPHKSKMQPHTNFLFYVVFSIWTQ